MDYAIIFMFGICLGYVGAYYSYKPVADLVVSLEKKHAQLLNILQLWQKKM